MYFEIVWLNGGEWFFGSLALIGIFLAARAVWRTIAGG